MNHPIEEKGCGCPGSRPRPTTFSRRRLLGIGATALSTAAVGAYLIGPGMWQWQHAKSRANARETPEIFQVDTEPGPVDPALVARLANTSTSPQGAPIIITYHDIGYNKASSYTVTPEAFAAQMRLIHEAGWTTLTPNHIEAWQRGEPLPPHSVLITFDDGCMGVWQYAEPVLKRYNMQATAFIITGFVGTHAPYYMDWDKITDLHNTGRWDIHSHAHLGHVYVRTDANGAEGAFLTSQAWLADQNRVETDKEFHSRVTTDLTECKRQLSQRGFSEPRFFAYPFSAHESDTTQAAVVSLYSGGAFLDDANTVQVTSNEDVVRGLIRRMDVTGPLTLEGLVEKIELASPLDPPTAQPLLDRDGWTGDDNLPTKVVTIEGNRIMIDPGSNASASVDYQRMRTVMWDTYTVSADLVFETGSVATGMVVFVGSSQHQVVATFTRGSYEVTIGNASESIASNPNLPDDEPVTYHVEIAATPTSVTVTIDGQQQATLPLTDVGPRRATGGIGLISHRMSDTAPVSIVDNLTIR